jgi:hypothetical protein
MQTEAAQVRDQRIGATSAFENAAVRLAGNSSVELFDDGALLFSEQEQQLSRLEGASALLLPLMERGATISELTAELARRDVQGDVAKEWVISLLHQLAGMSVLQADAPDPLGPSRHAQSLKLASFVFRLSYESDELGDRIAPIFAHLETAPSSGAASFRIGNFGAGLVRIDEAGRPALLVPREQLAVRLKVFLLEQLFESRGSFAALHAALLSHGERGVLLLGSPGAGKSTLALALMRAGYAYGSDDVTLVNPDGTITGVPLAPGVKEGSWAIAEELGAELTPLPAHMRPDDQQVRFVHIRGDEALSTCPVDLIVNLRRDPGAIGEIRPMRSEEALAELLRESRASGGTCNIETMSALAQLVRGAESFHLHYAEAMEAADLIASLRKP